MILGTRFFRIKVRLFPRSWQKKLCPQTEAMGPARAKQGLEPSSASSYVGLRRSTMMVLKEVIFPFQAW